MNVLDLIYHLSVLVISVIVFLYYLDIGAFRIIIKVLAFFCAIYALLKIFQYFGTI